MLISITPTPPLLRVKCVHESRRLVTFSRLIVICGGAEEADASARFLLLWPCDCKNKRSRRRSEANSKGNGALAIPPVDVMSEDYSFVYWSSSFLSLFFRLTAKGSSCHASFLVFRRSLVKNATQAPKWQKISGIL